MPPSPALRGRAGLWPVSAGRCEARRTGARGPTPFTADGVEGVVALGGRFEGVLGDCAGAVGLVPLTVVCTLGMGGRFILGAVGGFVTAVAMMPKVEWSAGEFAAMGYAQVPMFRYPLFLAVRMMGSRNLYVGQRGLWCVPRQQQS